MRQQHQSRIKPIAVLASLTALTTGIPSAQAQTTIGPSIADRQAEAIESISTINREQQIAFLIRGKFLKRFQEAYSRVLYPDNEYRYSLVIRPTSAVIWAIADRPDLKSYIGRVIVVKTLTGDANLQAILCENNRSGSLLMPTPRIDTNLSLICAPGTTEQQPVGPEVATGNSEAQTYVGSMNRYQQAYYMESEKFASTFDEFETGLGIKPITDRYEYSVQSSSQFTLQYGITRRANLKSYVGLVQLSVATNGEATTRTILCENISPGPIRPASPIILNSGELACGVGTRKR
jgi:Type IV pilin-like G and H, putative